MYFDIWRRFSARIVLLLLLALTIPFTSLLHHIGYPGLLFIATVTAVYLFWIPVRYLLSAAIGLLVLSALLFTPLQEESAEKLLRSVYYILILVVSRELVSTILAPWRFSHSIRTTAARLESYHYRAAAWLVRKSILTFRSMNAAFVRHSISYTNWKGYMLSKIPSFLILVMRGAEYVSTPVRHILQVRLVFFAVLTMLVVLPWFWQSGYLFLLDYVWPPHLPSPQLQSGFITGLPHEWTFWLAAQTIPTPIVQKIVFALPIFLAGLSAAHLISWILKEESSSAQPLLASLIAGTFYALNPLVVTRVFMGQIYFLLGYALVPWAALAALQFAKRATLRSGLIVSMSIVGVMISNAHHIVLLPLIIIPLLIGPLVYRCLLARQVSILIAPLALFSALFFTVRSVVITEPPSLNPLGPWARLLQAPFSGNVWLDIIALTAHWKTDLLFAFPYELLPQFSPFVIALTMIMGAGIWYFWQQRTAYPRLVWQLLSIAAVSVFLASGVSHPLTEPVASWLYRYVPFWIGMRDSAKFIANLALVETVLLGAGMAALTKTIPAKRLASGALLILMLWFVSPAYNGFSGQVLPTEYPESWRQGNNTLVAREPKPTMLVLPWHMYPTLAWLENRPVINPAAHFFDQAEVIVGDNSEVGGMGESIVIFSESTRPFSRRIETLLQTKAEIHKLGPWLAEDDITHVALLADAIDADAYQFLYNQQDLELVFESSELVIWKNNEL